MALFEKNTNEFLGEAGFISYNSYANRCEVGYRDVYYYSMISSDYLKRD